METKKSYNFRFPAGSTHLMVGPSGSGKTQRVLEILKLKSEIIEGGHNIRNVVYFYNTWQQSYSDFKKENIVTDWDQRTPSIQLFKEKVLPYKDEGGSIVVIDDRMIQINRELVEIVCVASRHCNTTTFILFQSLFPIEKEGRQISLNVKFVHLHANPREGKQFDTLARQILPNSHKWLSKAYEKVTGEPYSCFLIDFTQDREPALRFRSHYLPYEFPMCVYYRDGEPPMTEQDAHV